MKTSYLVDSNLIIYAGQPRYHAIRRFIQSEVPCVSVVSKIETLGYHQLLDKEQDYLHAFFDAAILLEIAGDIIEEAIRLRQKRSISLGDSLIGATALTQNLTLATHNTNDFAWIDTLEVLDPLEERS